MSRTDWKNLPDTSTPVNAENLKNDYDDLDGKIPTIQNSNSNSQTDAYSCEYINLLPKTLETKGTYPAGSDIDDAIDAGVYFCNGSPSHAPYSNGFLMVLRYGNWVKQIYLRGGITGTNDYMTAVRTLYIGGEWSGWKVFSMT